MTGAPELAEDAGVKAPEPGFEVLGVTALRHSAVPTLEFDLHVTEPTGRQVYTIALTTQIMLEPARRPYDAETRGRLVELFGEPERWGTTTRSLLWTRADVLVPSFTGATTFKLAVPCSYDFELVATKYFYALPGGQVPLALNFNGTILYREDDGRMQMTLVPWSCSAEFRMPVSAWHDLMAAHYPGRAWVGMDAATLEALRQEQARRGLPTLDALIQGYLETGDE